MSTTATIGQASSFCPSQSFNLFDTAHFPRHMNAIYPDTQMIPMNEPFQSIEQPLFQPDSLQNASPTTLFNASTGTKRSRAEFELSRDNFLSRSTVFDSLIPNPSENVSFDVHGAISYPVTPFPPPRKCDGFVVFAQNVSPIKRAESRLKSMEMYHRLVVNQVSLDLSLLISLLIPLLNSLLISLLTSLS